MDEHADEFEEVEEETEHSDMEWVEEVIEDGEIVSHDTDDGEYEVYYEEEVIYA
jgi:hypothetical protein